MSFAAGAFARTRRALGPTKDVPVAMVKWWKKVKDTNGEVRFAVLLPSASALHSQPLSLIFFLLLFYF